MKKDRNPYVDYFSGGCLALAAILSFRNGNTTLGVAYICLASVFIGLGIGTKRKKN